MSPAQSPASLLRLSCAVCDRIVDAVLDFFRIYQYELSVSAERQHRTRSQVVFVRCIRGSTQISRLPRGFAALIHWCSSDSARICGIWRKVDTRKHASNGVRARHCLRTQNCPACQKASEAERAAIREVAEYLRSDSKE